MPSPTKPMTTSKPGSRTSLSPDLAGTNTGTPGRTPPPPAPSSGYAKRAWQLQDGVDSPGEVEEVSASYRRGRAGTLPSSFHGPTPEGQGPAQAQVPGSNSHIRTSALSPAYPAPPSTAAAAAVRPGLRHTNSSTANLDNPSSNRLRSGSLTLTLPENGLGNGSVSSPFGTGTGIGNGNGWLGTPGINSGPSKSPLGQLYNNDNDHDTAPLAFDTLDYLGLADEGQGQPASMSEMRSQAQRAIAQSGPASRNRASTVSNFGRPSSYRPTSTSSYRYDATGQSTDEELSRAIDSLGMGMGGYDDDDYSDPANGHFYATAGIFNRDRDPNRPRSTTLGTVNDNPLRRGHSLRRAGYLASIPQSPVSGHMATEQAHNIFGYNPRSYSERDLTRSRESSSSRGPRHSHSMSTHTSRTGTPDFDKVGQTPQMPTRSLWIGNLDVNATSDSLFQVFSPYGPIESVRLLPEKTCAFVNYMDRSDAVRARDDVLNRMGGQVTALSETAPVRIGFGKIDSAPNGPSMSTVAPTPPGLVFTNGSIGGAALPPPVTPAPVNDEIDDNADLSALPTRALWIGNIPGTTSSATLLQVFSPFGPVESARVLMQRGCGFVNFERLDSAVAARNALNGYEVLGSDVGPVKIGYARIQTKSPLLGGPEEDESPQIGQVLSGLTNVEGANSVTTAQQLSADAGGVENYRSPLVLEMVKNGVHDQVLDKGLGNGGVVSEQQMIMQVLSAGRVNEDADVRAAAETRPPVSYYTTLPPPPGIMRRSDIGRLKELRRRLDSGQCTLEEINSITVELMIECAELASDYIGNTVIQKLFERCSPELRMEMLRRIAPHLAAIGVHKNGTWAAQKIIECSITDEERYLITSYLRPFGPSLMCDSLGNYVCAGTLKFGPPFSEYVFDAMVDRMWDIAQNRFGARCMRTCLESQYTPMYQKKRISTGVILNSIPLATNPNGALLLTWLVEQSQLNGRYGLLANRFAPHIAHLCTHKLASLTVLRIITQTSEPNASTILTNAIFTSPQDQTLGDILSDANNGTQVIGKLLAITSIPSAEKEVMVEAVRRVLPGINTSTPPYRVLCEAVGLPVPPQATPSPVTGRNQNRGYGQQQWPQQQYQPTFQHQHQQYGGFSQNQGPNPYQFQQQGYGHGHGHGPGMNLSPLLVPQNMALGQMRGQRHDQSDPNLTPMPNHGSPRTPVPQYPNPNPNLHPNQRRGQNQMMSPTSDPFNPFASPSIDSPYMSHPPPPGAGIRLSSQLGQQIANFEQQPNLGGLGIVDSQPGSGPGQGQGQGQGQYQSLMGGMYAAGPPY